MSGGELFGDPDQTITGAASLAEAVQSEISFFADPRYGPLLKNARFGGLCSAQFLGPRALFPD